MHVKDECGFRTSPIVAREFIILRCVAIVVVMIIIFGLAASNVVKYILLVHSMLRKQGAAMFFLVNCNRAAGSSSGVTRSDARLVHVVHAVGSMLIPRSHHVTHDAPSRYSIMADFIRTRETMLRSELAVLVHLLCERRRLNMIMMRKARRI